MEACRETMDRRWVKCPLGVDYLNISKSHVSFRAKPACKASASLFNTCHFWSID